MEMTTGRMPAHLAFDDQLAVTRPLDVGQQFDRSAYRRWFLAPLLALMAILMVASASSVTSAISAALSAAGMGNSSNREINDPRANVVTVVEPTLEPVTIEVMEIGDILMSDAVVMSGASEDGTYNYDHIYENISDDIAGADLRIVNQETIMGLPERGYFLTMGENGPRFNSPLTLADAEAKAGFNVVLKSHNHTYDQGYDGLAHELDYWHATYPEIVVIGVKNPAHPDDASQNWVDNVYIYEKNGFRVAVLNYTFGINEVVDWTTYYEYAAPLLEQKVRLDVSRAREANVDMIIACPHWGIEYQTTPSAEQENFASLFCELGVDVVFGGHPHIIEPTRVLTRDDGHQTVCFFSNGNFIAGDMPADSMIGGVYKTTLVKETDGTCYVASASMLPTIAHKAEGTAYTTYLLSDYTDGLAASSQLPELTPDYAQDFCEQVLGAGYDRKTSTLTVL